MKLRQERHVYSNDEEDAMKLRQERHQTPNDKSEANVSEGKNMPPLRGFGSAPGGLL